MNCPRINEEELERVLKVLGNGTIPGSNLDIGEHTQIGGGAIMIGLLWMFGLLTSVHPDTGSKMMGALAVGGCKAFSALARVTRNPQLKTLDKPGNLMKPVGAACLLFGGLVQEIASVALSVPYYYHDLMSVAKLLKSDKNITMITEIIDEVDRNTTKPEFPVPVPFVLPPQPAVNNRTKTAVVNPEVPPPPPPHPSSNKSPSEPFYALRDSENQEVSPTPGYVYPLGYIEAILLGLGIALRNRGIPNPILKTNKKLNQQNININLEKYRNNFGAVPIVNSNKVQYRGKIPISVNGINYSDAISVVPKDDSDSSIWAMPQINRQKTPIMIVHQINRKKTPNILVSTFPNQISQNNIPSWENNIPSWEYPFGHGGRVKTRKRRMMKHHHKKRRTRSKRA